MNHAFDFRNYDEVLYKCPKVNTDEIGIVYLSLPHMDDYNTNNDKRAPKWSFKLTNYYNILLLTKYFQSSESNRLLFYYINDVGAPQSNHYNRWLNDTFWNDKIPSNSINFIKINYTSVNTLNDIKKIDFYLLLRNIIKKSMFHFDKPKKFILFLTGDSIIGPKVLSCFSLDLNRQYIKANDIIEDEKTSFQTSFDCYKKLNSNNNDEFKYCSFLYSFDLFNIYDSYSGIFIWRVDYTGENIKADDKEIIIDDNNASEDDDLAIKEFKKKSITDSRNIYKCVYKNKVFKNEAKYENVLCIFGYDLNKYELPLLEDIFHNHEKNYFYRIIRRLLYNRYDTFKYEKLVEPKIPNIVHLIWFGEEFKLMKFIEYLCLKSIILNIKPDKVKIHGDVKPYGEYWDRIKLHPKIEWVYLERPLRKYGQDFTSSPIQHLADIARLEVLYDEGGLYSDFDILWIKSTNELRYLDVELIASNDITSYCLEFPNNIQIGTFLSRPKASFLQNWLKAYENYHLYPGDYTAISMCEPYKIYEKTPQRVHINNRLQMIFFNGWNIFIPRYVDINSVREYNENMDWLNNGTFGYHLPRHGPLFTKEEYDRSNKNDLSIRIATYILNQPYEDGFEEIVK